MARPPPLLPLLPHGTASPVLPRHLRSSLGRRPPFYPLAGTVSIDSISLEELECGDAAVMKPYSDGVAVGGRKGWNDEHERIMDWFYQPGSPCLVDPRFPSQHSGYLSPEAVDVRARGRPAIAYATQSLTYTLHKSFFVKQYVNPWLSLKNKKKQQQLLLSVLADVDRMHPTFGKNRKLLPEVVLEDPLAEGGQGLVSLFNRLRDHLGVNDLVLSEHPIPNEKFFRKFGIVDDQQVPASSSDRAFQEEYLMRRHSLLLAFVDLTLQRIIGQSAPASSQPIASTPSDVTRNSELPSTFGSPGRFFVEERCTTCNKVARNAETNQLLMCLKCKKNVDRIQVYCSETCQKEHWPKHKKDCGKSIRDIHPIPTPIARPASPSSSSSASKTAKPRSVSQRRLQSFIRTNLEANPEEFWFYHTSQGYARMGCDGWGDDARGLRIRKAMRKLVFKAIDGDSPSIDLLCFVLEAVLVNAPIAVGTTRQDLKVQPLKSKDEYGVEHLRETFGLEKESLWKEAKERGKLALKKEGNEAVKELYDGTMDAGFKLLISPRHGKI
ncbi:hypothetical protein JCM5350_002685 [Sporobolomyces pararoseus]